MRRLPWDAPDVIALLALLIGIALGTLSGYTLHLDTRSESYEVDNQW